MNREDAIEIFNNIRRTGTYTMREAFLSSFDDEELGYWGKIAKDFSKTVDPKFTLGVELGIMIGLNLVYNFRKEN